MTEEEAKTKWCPHARVLEGYAERTSANRTAEGKPAGLCIGSGCMAWRWVDGPEDVFMGDPKLGGRLEKAEGYCGLADPIS